MGCNPVVSVIGSYPSKDVQGNALLNIRGLVFEALPPGATDWAQIGKVAYPQTRFDWPVSSDGEYAFRFRVQRNAVLGPNSPAGNGAVNCVVTGEPSDPVAVTVSASAPAKPAAPLTVVPCPDCDELVTG